MDNNIKDNKGQKTAIMVFIIGLLIGLIIGFLIFSDKEKGTLFGNNWPENSNSESDNSIEASRNILKVADQSPGETVLIESASLTEPGWLVIYDDTNGLPGSILGAQYFDKGEYKNISVSLLIGTTADNTYHVLIHQDDGQIVESEFGRHEFDHTKDRPLVDSDNQTIKQSFMAISQGARGL